MLDLHGSEGTLHQGKALSFNDHLNDIDFFKQDYKLFII